MGSILPKLYFFFMDLYNFGSFSFLNWGISSYLDLPDFHIPIEEKRSTNCYGTRKRVPTIRESEKRRIENDII